MADKTVILRQEPIGPMQNFIYVIGDARTGEVAIVDPAWDVPYLLNLLKTNGWRLTSVFLTHGHPDHTNGLHELLRHHRVPVYLSRCEAEMFMPSCPGLTLVSDGDRLMTGAVDWSVLHTPGHSPGSQCFRHERILLTGDTLFINGCGRCDLPGSDPHQMYVSLYHKIYPLDDDIVIYPGHDYGPLASDTLGRQKKTNPYLTCRSEEEFIVQRMGFAV